jgi:hypothetical protein
VKRTCVGSFPFGAACPFHFASSHSSHSMTSSADLFAAYIAAAAAVAVAYPLVNAKTPTASNRDDSACAAAFLVPYRGAVVVALASLDASVAPVFAWEDAWEVLIDVANAAEGAPSTLAVHPVPWD